jgi:gliding motility-associated-like protein
MLTTKTNAFVMASIGLLAFLCGWSPHAFSQTIASRSHQTQVLSPFKRPTPFAPKENDKNLFGDRHVFIENIGQYEETLKGCEHLGAIRFTYNGLSWPVLFTDKGVIYRQQKVEKRSEEELEEAEREGLLDEKEENQFVIEYNTITMEWLNANPNPVIVAEMPATHYYTYGKLPAKAKGFKRLWYKDLYPGIDLIYRFTHQDQVGFEYMFIIRPGADWRQVKMRWGGEIKELELDAAGNLMLVSDIDEIKQTAPVSYYANEVAAASQEDKSKIRSQFALQQHDVRLQLLDSYDSTRTLIIDPFVTAITSFTGDNRGIAKDVDFDYEGNIYVTGGGANFGAHQLAKFDKDGNLLWTFSGTVANPFWTFGSNYGGWVVEKSTGKIYMGQGGVIFQVVRLNTDGIYDNYITTRDNVFQENWKMLWNCDGGTPKIMIAGGGSVGENINLGIFAPPSTSLSPLNITGQHTGHQDMSDLIIDPRTNELYSIFSQGFITPITENNRMYKHAPPYNTSKMVWNRLSGFSVLSERSNRPYLGMGLNDNSINSLAVNANNLFYYDGYNLMALDKGNGSNVGASTTISMNTPLKQGGIIADECNNVFVGSSNGLIKVYKFTGSGFDDGAASDISIAGFGTSAVYDLAYDNAKRLLYAAGNGFVGAFDISSYCTSRIYTLPLKRDCENGSVQATLTPSLPAGSTLVYILYQGTTELANNTTGVFTGLDKTTTYTIKAQVDKACGGPQVIRTFDLTDCSFSNDPDDDPPPTDPGKSGIYVPTAFTPDGDGKNDVLKVTARGMKTFKYFTLYNRWGEQVFTTTDSKRGWDGKVKGKEQASGTFVWMVECVGFDDKVYKQKGTTILIR